MAQWIRPWTLSHEVPGSNLLAAAVVPLGKALYPHCLVHWKGLKPIGPCCLIISSLPVRFFLLFSLPFCGTFHTPPPPFQKLHTGI